MNEPTSVIGAVGYLAERWPNLNAAGPAVIVNPAASPADVLAWCWGEVQSLACAAEAISASRNGCDAAEFGAVFVHRLGPLSRVMERAVTALSQQPAHLASPGNKAGE
ncbi:hypothetical protein [Oryzisolibacter sp. LB2S]|uniref:hypothetical protein n=1 Tax=Alicycliphilus soli TaxID=3228789 RepID=UPI00345B10A6